jgi:integrase
VAYVVPKKLGNGRRAYLVRYKAPDGSPRSKQFGRRRDADLFASSIEVEIAHGVFVDPDGGKETLAEWVDRWWPTTVHLRETSRARDGSVLRIHVLPKFGRVPLGRIEHLAVREWIAELTARGYKPTTVHKCHQVLAKTLRAAVDARKLRYNPADNVPLPRVEREEMRFLTPREIAHLAAAIDARYRHFVILAAYTGLRVGEIAGLTWGSVDLLRRHLDVVQSLVELNGAIVVNPPKTRAGRRRVPIPRVVADALASSTAANPAADDWVVAAPEGGALRVPVFRRRFWGPAVERAGFDRLRIHDLRHTAVALWIAAGASPNEIAARAGHRSVVTVLDRYGHLLPDRRDDITAELDRMARG